MSKSLLTHPNKCIDGVRRNKNIVGYCWSDIHRGFLTNKLLEEHDCIKKQCKHLEKYNCPYWTNYEKKLLEKAKIKAKKKEEKEILKEIYLSVTDILKDCDGFKIETFELTGKKKIKIRFISLDYVSMKTVSNLIYKAFGYTLYWQNIKVNREEKLKRLGIEDKHREKLQHILKKTINNEHEVALSKICGCTNCIHIFPPTEITKYRQDMFRTARCPYCGKPSVIPDSDEYKINKKLLKELKNEYSRQSTSNKHNI